jgi:hypothetical protein
MSLFYFKYNKQKKCPIQTADFLKNQLFQFTPNPSTQKQKTNAKEIKKNNLNKKEKNQLCNQP